MSFVIEFFFLTIHLRVILESAKEERRNFSGPVGRQGGLDSTVSTNICCTMYSLYLYKHFNFLHYTTDALPARIFNVNVR